GQGAAFRLRAVRARTAQELERRLVRRGFSPAVAAEVLAWCQSLGYVNDELFAEDWIRNRTGSRPSGRRRIEHELREKGIHPELARRKMAERLSDEDEQARGRELAGQQYARLSRWPPAVQR